MSAFNKFADPKVRMGLPASELWGVAESDRSRPRRKRSDRAAARRRAKRNAAKANVTLKSYLRRRV